MSEVSENRGSALASNAPEGVRFLDVLRRELARAERADFAVAFLRFSGLSLLWQELDAFSRRGGALRVLTSTYLNVTQPDALRVLARRIGEDRLRIFDAPRPGFHMKLYLFGRDGGGACWVGSSNLTKGGLAANLELNLRHEAPRVVAEVRDEFERLWVHRSAHPPTEAFIADYERRCFEQARATLPMDTPPSSASSGSDADALAGAGLAREAGLARTPSWPSTLGASIARDGDLRPPRRLPSSVAPNPAQVEALERLAALRARGERRAAVVAAPGIGKTYLSAFDARAAGARRVLFVSHRLEHLRQAERSFARVFPGMPTALLDGGASIEAAARASLVFASIQTLRRRAEQLPQHWDYVVVDEFHHAHAPSYRAALAEASDAFLLGLTATPERQDGHDVLQLCDYNVAWEVRVPEAIRRGWLVSFHYFAVADETVDYAALPWRSGRFDPEALEVALSVEQRVELALRHALDKGYDGPRRATVGFCAGRRHADYMAKAFGARGQVARVVTGETPIDERLRVYRDFADPDHPLEWLFVADVLNEGVDIPAINSVLFLRPTDSATIFIQQLGRGLRLHPGCEVLTVVDLVGHHRRAWLAIESLQDPAALAGPASVEGLPQVITPPPGCEIVLDDATRAILTKVERFTGRRRDRCREAWARMRAELGAPPWPVDFVGAQEDVGPEDIRAVFGDWIAARIAMGDAEPWERSLDAAAPLRRLLARCESNWQAQRVYAWARLWASVVDPGAPREAYARFFERFPRWGAEGEAEGFDRAAKTLAKKLDTLWQGEGLDPRVFEGVDAERLRLEVERRIQYQLEKDFRIRHGGVLRGPAELVPWRRYARPEIINHFGRQFDPARHNFGVITFAEPAFADEVVIITKMDTRGADAKYHYVNGFEDASTFRWQSQNKNRPDDPIGRRLVTPGAARLHLFVQERSHATAVYCGAVAPIRHENAAPIDVWFRLASPVPAGVMRGLDGG
jgi:superfamily II DNA or RNA helicase/HKD family nuclease